MKEFKEVLNDNIETLKVYVPVVERVHGTLHPEFKEVKVNFDSLLEKLEINDYNLDLEFSNLSKITNNYLIPSDVCETYEAVYNMLEALNKSYIKITSK